jgi:hypothetical protein
MCIFQYINYSYLVLFSSRKFANLPTYTAKVA